MDRVRFAQSHAAGITRVTGDLPTSDRLIASRQKARHTLTKAIDHRTGPILLTGDYGVGKTRLRKAIQSESKAGRAWLNLDAAPGTTVADLYLMLNHALGCDDSSFDRTRLSEQLGLGRLDKSEWILAIDEAHNLDDIVLEEVRLLSNRLGSADGFAAIVLIGHSSLVRRLSLRSNLGLAERIAAHVHLSPLDADEVLELFKQHDAKRDWPIDLVERVHILSEGRPGRIVRMLGIMPEPATAPAAVPAPKRVETKPKPEPQIQLRPEPLLGPSKPPIVEEDGLIEVGWDPLLDEDDAEMADEPAHYGALASGPHSEIDYESETESDLESEEIAEEGEERINEHYAALQAWQEWSASQSRSFEATPVTPAPAMEAPSPLEATPNVWADEEHGFAPLSRLFGRKTQENEAE